MVKLTICGLPVEAADEHFAIAEMLATYISRKNIKKASFSVRASGLVGRRIVGIQGRGRPCHKRSEFRLACSVSSRVYRDVRGLRHFRQHQTLTLHVVRVYVRGRRSGVRPAMHARLEFAQAWSMESGVIAHQCHQNISKRAAQKSASKLRQTGCDAARVLRCTELHACWPLERSDSTEVYPLSSHLLAK